jgi:xylulokinase
MTTYLVGIDLGTTTCRCALFDPDGHEVAAVYREVRVDYPRPLWAEVDPDVWWRAVVEVVREAVGRVDASRIAAVGLSGLMHAPVLLDAEQRPLAPAMLWMDQRCAAQSQAMNAEAGDGERRAFATTVSAPKLRWLVESRPDLIARAGTFVLPKDYVRIRLTGVGGTDTSDAGGTGLWDRDGEAWLPEAVELARIPRSLLPETRPATALAGGVTAEAAAATGLPAGTPVAVGGSDVYCTRIAVGPLAEGEVCLYMGTAAWMAFLDAQSRPRGFGSTATTGAALRWARDLLAGNVASSPAGGSPAPRAPAGGPAPTAIGASYEQLLDGAESIEPGSEGLFFLPHLMGERGPTPEPLARGALIGLTLRHGRAHVARAVVEGTAFQIRRNFDERAPSPVRGGVVAGGAAKSRLWMQTLVDVVGVALRVPATAESSVLGAAMLGGVAAGRFSLAEGQARMVRPGATFGPDAERSRRYDALYRRYCQLDAMLLPWFREIGEGAW